MPAVRTYERTGNAYIDGLLGDVRWVDSDLTFSFPTDATLLGPSYGYGETTDNFAPLKSAQHVAARSALREYAAVAQLGFTEIVEASDQEATLRFALSDLLPTAWAYFPTTASEGGDTWFNRSSGAYSAPAKGSYAYATFLHEIGHALGLEHPHQNHVMPSDRDSLEYSVMSYRSYVGSSEPAYVNDTWSFPQTLMILDIAAIQHIYGANYATNSGNTVYSWSPSTGELFVNGQGQSEPGANRIFQTIWDGDGIDEFDFSAFATDLDIDLSPGRWTKTSPTQLADLHFDGSKPAIGNIGTALLFEGDTRSLVENAIGGTGNDRIIGNAADNVLQGRGGSDYLDGNGGRDTASFEGLRSDFYAVQRGGLLELMDLRSGLAPEADVLVNIEALRFDDGAHDVSSLGAVSGFSHDGSWTGAGHGAHGWYVGDFDGDGRDDLFRYVPGRSGAEVFVSKGNGFSLAGSWTGAGSGSPGWYVGDFDGNGRDDIFRYVPGRSGAEVFLSNGSGFSAAGSWTGAGSGSQGWYVGDFDGDGRDDIFRYVPGRSGAEVLLSTGSGFAGAGSWTGGGTSGWTVGDFDGDGRDDILRQKHGTTNAEVLLSAGSRFASPALWLESEEDHLEVLRPGDFDGDGRDDLLGAPRGAVHVSSGSFFFSTGEWVTEAADWKTGDFDGNGQEDVFRYLAGETGADMWLA